MTTDDGWISTKSEKHRRIYEELLAEERARDARMKRIDGVCVAFWWLFAVASLGTATILACLLYVIASGR